MKGNYELQHRVAKLNPYHSIDKLLDGDPDKYLVGIKNVSSIPNTLMHRLEKTGFSLHTIDKKSRLAGRAIDLDLINPITGHYMSGSSSGTAINVFAGINDLGIGNDGGGSVLAPAICVNIYGFISPLIEKDRIISQKPNTDGIVAGNSLGFMARDRKILFAAIEGSIGIKAKKSETKIFSDKEYKDIVSTLITPLDSSTPRLELTQYLKKTLGQCDLIIVEEGPIDLEGFGDSLFGHYNQQTKEIQKKAKKGYVRVCNLAGATALAIPTKDLGVATLLMCESTEDKISKLLSVAAEFTEVHDELTERYFLNLENYFNDGYQI